MTLNDRFILFDNAQEFRDWLFQQEVNRDIRKVQQHHTGVPNYETWYKNPDHFTVQRGMWDYHVNKKGWSDIAQHASTFPDGRIMLGRSLDRMPAGILGANAGAFCFEHVGNFNEEDMTAAQRQTIIEATAAVCERFGIEPSADTIPYHHWYDRVTGKRNWGEGGTIKSCPGRDFFGGNKRHHAEGSFYPLVKAAMNTSPVNTFADVIEPTPTSITTIVNNYSDYFTEQSDLFLNQFAFWKDRTAGEHNHLISRTEKIGIAAVLLIFVAITVLGVILLLRKF